MSKARTLPEATTVPRRRGWRKLGCGCEGRLTPAAIGPSGELTDCPNGHGLQHARPAPPPEREA